MKNKISKSAANQAAAQSKETLDGMAVSYRLEVLERRLAQLSSDFRDDFFPTLEKMRQFWEKISNEMDKKKVKKSLILRIKEFLGGLWGKQ